MGPCGAFLALEVEGAVPGEKEWGEVGVRSEGGGGFGENIQYIYADMFFFTPRHKCDS